VALRLLHAHMIVTLISFPTLIPLSRTQMKLPTRHPYILLTSLLRREIDWSRIGVSCAEILIISAVKIC